MTKSIAAHFDGTVLVPGEAVELPVGEPLRLHIELTDSSIPRFADLLELEADLPDAPRDLAAQHDHYLYGSPKR
jgi:hypothetical protein